MRALLSVYDKTGIVEFAQGLERLGWEIVSTGGTLNCLRFAGVNAISVADVTGFPEILDGRVKTLHPRIHGGLLGRPKRRSHHEEMTEFGIEPIELLAVNLYPFEATLHQPDVTHEEAIEQIDIGGPAMLRAAAKNHENVIVLVDVSDYEPVLSNLSGDGVGETERRDLAAKAFQHTSAYDTVVSEYLRKSTERSFPREFTIAGRKALDLRYGENPHQAAAAYTRLGAGRTSTGILDGLQLHGKELSFNNLLDADAGWAAVQGWQEPAVAIVKHTIPCGLSVREKLADSFVAALEGDPVSAFGGIVACNRVVDPGAARLIGQTFFEIVVAPGFDPSALSHLSEKRNLRLLQMPAEVATGLTQFDIRLITGGLLVQEPDNGAGDDTSWKIVTRRSPSIQERDDLRFAWQVVRLVKSNAIVLAKDRAVAGVGSGQPNRLESVNIAAKKAGTRAQGAVLASDAFFPFADGIEAAAALGVSAVIQPGGSIRDEEVIQAADDSGIAMIFTGIRHFRH